MASSRRRFLCVDCGVDTGKIHEHYFVHTELWLRVMPSTTGMLCIGDFEKRLGRQLMSSDFTNATVNSPKFEAKSQRLMSRLTAH